MNGVLSSGFGWCVLQCVIVCCSELQCALVCVNRNKVQRDRGFVLRIRLIVCVCVCVCSYVCLCV